MSGRSHKSQLAAINGKVLARRVSPGLKIITVDDIGVLSPSRKVALVRCGAIPDPGILYSPEAVLNVLMIMRSGPRTRT